jgi:hypothetical protein
VVLRSKELAQRCVARRDSGKSISEKLNWNTVTQTKTLSPKPQFVLICGLFSPKNFGASDKEI